MPVKFTHHDHCLSIERLEAEAMRNKILCGIPGVLFFVPATLLSGFMQVELTPPIALPLRIVPEINVPRFVEVTMSTASSLFRSTARTVDPAPERL